jgi:hypothetical protein
MKNPDLSTSKLRAAIEIEYPIHVGFAHYLALRPAFCFNVTPTVTRYLLAIKLIVRFLRFFITFLEQSLQHPIVSPGPPFVLTD